MNWKRLFQNLKVNSVSFIHPTWLLKECLEELLPSLTKIINDSLEKAYVPKSFKSSLIRPLIKKSGLDLSLIYRTYLKYSKR